MMKNPPLIWLIDGNHWERAMVGAELIERGFAVEGFEDILHAVLMFYREMRRPDVIVLDMTSLFFQVAELDEVERFGAPVLLLTGVYEEKSNGRWAAVLRRPFTIGRIVETVRRLVAGRVPKV